MSAQEYWVSFNTDTVKKTGILTGTKVTLETGTLGPDETARVDLADHPLYPELRKYCLSNPPRK